jgi:hypothetical protein
MILEETLAETGGMIPLRQVPAKSLRTFDP